MPDKYEWSWCLEIEKDVRIATGWEIIGEPIGVCNIFGAPMYKYIIRKDKGDADRSGH